MPEAASKTRREKVEEKERAILAATRAVFRDKGPEDAKITAIAQAANLAEGTVYLYFKNKQALLMAAVSEFYAELTQDAEAAVRAAHETKVRLTALAQLHFSRVLDEWPLIAEAMGPYLPSREYRETEAYALNRRYVAVFDGVIRDGISRGEIRADVSVAVMRDAFYGGLEHFARSARLRDSQPDTKAEVAQFLTVFTAGIMDRPSAGVLDGARVIRRLQGVITDIEDQLRAGQQGDVDMQDGEGTQ
ncbi:TetR/AcrR family transcriptional regulator [Lutimaribacter saemankumensis]|uniref:DNA-binding transcriptional regulator, AcrR family n=1 Tax=Lutimaribacter saemankumensis TaxID=490829 RepID=A0A1G8SD09_9RHOB|nr:TetR/AcrR family transcriptional regulator [Lutimaribacter saemankumensis]SDJ27064.1 DNA-binding transcriptional regulator, AcrR family [Lutimaribacter saemankumensis]